MIRIRTRVESDTISIPELRLLIGKDVEITVREEPSAHQIGDRSALHGSVSKYDSPFEPAADAEAILTRRI